MKSLLLLLQIQALVGLVTSLCQQNGFTSLSNETGILMEPQNPDLYNGNLGCAWVISDTNSPDVLFFNVSYVDLEEVPQGCWTDHLQIMDYPLLQTFWADLCGTLSSPVLIRGVSNAARISFLTERPGPENTGFTLEWYYAPICSGGPMSLSGEFGSLQPFDWPDYDGNPDCQWLITVSDDMYIEINIGDFVTSGVDCNGDYLTIVNGENHDELWATICSTDINYVTGSTNTALITYHTDSDYQVSDTFTIYWSESSTQGQLSTTTSPSTPYTGPTTPYTGPTTPYTGSTSHSQGGNSQSGSSTTTSLFVLEECTGDGTPIEYQRLTGTFSSPTDADVYDGYSDCIWWITVPNHKDVVFLKLTYLNLVDHDGVCLTDQLLIYNGHVGSDIWADLCGTVTSPVIIRGKSNYAKVELLFNVNSLANAGFTMEWYFAPICSGGPVILNGGVQQESLQPTDWPDYDGNPDCQWQLTVADGMYVEINATLVTSATDCNGDYLMVVSADQPTDVWAKLCGTSSAVIKGVTNSALVTYYTDNDYQNSDSFQIYWQESSEQGVVAYTTEIPTTTGTASTTNSTLEATTQLANALRPLHGLVALAVAVLAVVFPVI